MSFVNVPEAPGSTGQNIETIVVTSSQHRQLVIIGSPFTTQMTPVTSSGGVLAAISNPTTAVSLSSAATVTLSSAPLVIVATSGGTIPAALSSGTVTLSSVHTVTATAATNPWSSAPSFNIPFVSASSGLLQISGTPLVNIVGTSSGVAPVTTSGGLGITILAGGTTSVTLSSAPLVIVATSGGTQLVALSSAPLVIVASSGGTALRAITSGTITLSSAIGVSSGTITLSSATSLSSGTVTLSSVHTVTATAGTNPWSSAPGFDLPVESASSGLIGIFPSTGYAYTAFTFGCSSSMSFTTVSTVARTVYGWNVGSMTAGVTAIRVYNSTSTTSIGSTTNLILVIPIPGSTGLGAGNNNMMPQGVVFDSRVAFLIVDSFITTSTALGTHAAGDITGTLYYI